MCVDSKLVLNEVESFEATVFSFSDYDEIVAFTKFFSNIITVRPISTKLML